MNCFSIRTILLLPLVCSFVAPSSACADSLWKRARPQYAYLVEDSRARRPGDLLTVIINESTEVQNRENRALNKASSASGVFDLAGATAVNSVSGNFDASGQNSRGFSGDATYRNSREVLDHITVTVVSVSRNGNLWIVGERDITISGDQRTLKIQGWVRPVDIGPDNTVSSRFIAEMKTIYQSPNGPEKHFTRQGIAGRLMNSIWPF